MTYEYLCTLCGHAWEAEQSISAAALKECPSCHQEGAKRQVSGGAGFILKGGGWYADLYGSAPKKSSSDSESKSSDTKSSDTSTKKESTPTDKGSGSSGTSGSSGSGSSGTPTPAAPAGSKATGAASGA